MVQFIRAESAGFCMGVDLALRKLERLVQNRSAATPVCTLGPIIHNPQVLKHYADLGVQEVAEPEELPRQSSVVIRAHGIPRDVQSKLSGRGIHIVDATCPKVKKAQLLIQDRTATEGRSLILFGEPEHPEVAGLLSYAGGQATVIEAVDQFEQLSLDPGASYVLAAQTTQDRTEYNKLISKVQATMGCKVPVLDTICDTTRERQREAADIAAQVDTMVVVGGYNSGNTRRLVQVVRGLGTRCFHVEQADELDPDGFAAAKAIGLTAGASTPKEIIDAVEARIHSFFDL
jgi:4-hydroxy-3-methylbut-2-enyl diphosphate reductase